MGGASIEDTEAGQQRSRLMAEQAALRRMATLVAQGVPADKLFTAVTEEVGRLFGADLAGLGRYVSDDSVSAVAWWAAQGEHPDISGTWPLDDDSMTGTIFRTGRPARQDHWEAANGPIAEVCRRLGICSTAASPIVVDGATWGALMIHSKTSRLPSGTESRMAGFTELVATAISNIRARAETRRLADEQAALRRVATLVARETSAADVFAAVAEEVGRLLAASVSTLYRYEDDGTVTVVADWGDADARLPVGTRMPLDGDSLVVRVRRSAASERMDDYVQMSGAIGTHARELGVRAGVGTPIIVEGRLWGGIVAVSRRPEPLPADAETRIAQFTELLATAISNMEARAELAASRARLVAAADEERRRVARDLHDGAQQRLVHTVLTLNMARQAIENNERARALLREAAGHAQLATAELRELAHRILPSVLVHGGLRAGVDSLASRMPVPVASDVPRARVPAMVEATAYFVIAQRVTVTARIEHDTLHVEVHDDGVGGPQLDERGRLAVADRLAAVGGRLEIASSERSGTRLAAAIPLSAGD
jgi:GAF domain-containing protein